MGMVRRKCSGTFSHGDKCSLANRYGLLLLQHLFSSSNKETISPIAKMISVIDRDAVRCVIEFTVEIG
jgi:hypothetical protein